MNIKKIPITASELSFIDVLTSIKYLNSRNLGQDLLCDSFIKKTGASHWFFMNSGLAGFFLILKTLKKSSSKKEVVIPAYTAGSLVVAIKKAELTPVLCDISLETFNLDLDQLGAIVGGNTLCIVGVHMFGLVLGGIGSLKSRFPDVIILEDACQSFGSLMSGVPVGSSGDIGFFSFNKGKNLPTFGGGAITTNDSLLAEQLKQESKFVLELKYSFWETLKLVFKLFALCLAVNKYVYGTFFNLIAKFKDTNPPEDVILGSYTNFQAGLANRLITKNEKIAKKRFKNGKTIIDALSQIEGVLCPRIDDNTMPAFNRLPILFKDINQRSAIEEKLSACGYETSRMYGKPLHEMFALGYKRGDFPNAEYLADHLLTLPTHPLLIDKDIKTIIAAITSNM